DGRGDNGRAGRCAGGEGRERACFSESKDGATVTAGDAHFPPDRFGREARRSALGCKRPSGGDATGRDTGEVRGFLRGGDATIEDLPENLELQLSDGVKSNVVRRNQPNLE